MVSHSRSIVELGNSGTLKRSVLWQPLTSTLEASKSSRACYRIVILVASFHVTIDHPNSSGISHLTVQAGREIHLLAPRTAQSGIRRHLQCLIAVGLRC